MCSGKNSYELAVNRQYFETNKQHLNDIKHRLWDPERSAAFDHAAILDVSSTMRYRRSNEVFCSAIQRSLFYQEQACSAVNYAGQRAKQEEESSLNR